MKTNSEHSANQICKEGYSAVKTNTHNSLNVDDGANFTDVVKTNRISHKADLTTAIATNAVETTPVVLSTSSPDSHTPMLTSTIKTTLYDIQSGGVTKFNDTTHTSYTIDSNVIDQWSEAIEKTQLNDADPTIVSNWSSDTNQLNTNQPTTQFSVTIQSNDTTQLNDTNQSSDTTKSNDTTQLNDTNQSSDTTKSNDTTQVE